MPAKSLVAREILVQRITPHLDALVDELLRIATTGAKDQDRITAIRELLLRSAGKVPDELTITSAGEAPKTVADLLKEDNDG